jgi:hypothetical protein
MRKDLFVQTIKPNEFIELLSNHFIIQSIFSKLLTFSLKSLNEFEKHLLSCAHYYNKIIAILLSKVNVHFL